MSVLIRGMEMPRVCAECFMDPPCCKALSDDINIWKERHPDCPLVEVKEPHGNLVDFDKMVEDYWDGALMVIDEQKFKQIESSVIIEAEGREK